MRDNIFLVLGCLLMQLLLKWNNSVVAFAPSRLRSFDQFRRSVQSSIIVRGKTTQNCGSKSFKTLPYGLSVLPATVFRGTSVYLSKNSSSSTFHDERVQQLHKHLELIGVDADELHAAALMSLENPAAGFDQKYGKSAIRTYRSFIYPKSKDGDDGDDKKDTIHLSASAARCARQVDFLVKRYKSHQAEWVRHHDTIRDRRQIFPLILILDNLRSAFNVGSLYRTADACGCEKVITCGITPNPNGNGAEKLAKSALGAELLVPSKHFATTREAIAYLRKEMPDYNIIGMETTENAKVYSKVDFVGKKIALILGNEVTGVDTEILSDIDEIVEIPTYGAKNSLNVASCAPVVLYEILRQWNV